ncbi:MAG: formylglycine-generating enzyme family protein [Deltaproteobacteria bacterium]|nr:formylglycine-generating enzyme family protein [Deltaproteobacteria bacterium]
MIPQVLLTVGATALAFLSQGCKDKKNTAPDQAAVPQPNPLQCPDGMALISKYQNSRVEEPFCIDVTEVTQTAYGRFVVQQPAPHYLLLGTSYERKKTSILAKGNDAAALLTNHRHLLDDKQFSHLKIEGECEFSLLQTECRTGQTTVVDQDESVNQLMFRYGELLVHGDDGFCDIMIKSACTLVMPDLEKKFLGPDKPIVAVTFNEAWTYCNAKGGSLPTETQWKLMAYDDATQEIIQNMKRNSRNRVKARSNVDSNGLTDVRTYPPNNYGVYDVIGNAAEWTLRRANFIDADTDYYGSEVRTFGGSWRSRFDSPNHVDTRAEDGEGRLEWDRYPGVGFRCVAKPLAGK